MGELPSQRCGGASLPNGSADFRNAAIEPNILVDNAVPLPSRAQRSPRLYILSGCHLKDRWLGGSASPAHPGQHPFLFLGNGVRS